MTKKIQKTKLEVAEETDEIRDLENELGKSMALEALRNSEGGKVLLAGFISDIISAVDTIATKPDSLTHIEYITLGCHIKERLDVARALSNAKSNSAFLHQVLKEELEKIQP